MPISINQKLRHLILALGCLLLIVSYNNLNPTANTSPGVVTFKVATDPTFIPFSYQSPNGKLQGFDIDLMNAIAQVTGLIVQFEPVPFDGMISNLIANKVDAAVNGITITSKRLELISFSKPYLKAGLAIAVRENNQDIKDLDSLKGKKIAVQIGTTGANFAKNIPNAKIITFNSAPEFFQELINGNVDAVICDAFATSYAIKTGSLQRIKIASELLTEEYYGIATPKNSPHLDAINKGIKTLLTNGTYRQIYQQWFKTEPEKLPESPPL